jgi:DNA-binding NarL/FixJ family response regulator
MIRVVICDDQEMVVEGLQAILSKAPTISVVGVAGDAVAALELIGVTRPDVLLLDLFLPGMSGIQTLRLLRTQYPAVRTLVLTTYDADEWVLGAVRAGAAGYLLKDTRRADLVRAIEGTAAGQSFIDPKVAGRLLEHMAGAGDTGLYDALAPESALSQREQDVLRLLVAGRTNGEIAQQLALSEGTVRNYMTAIFAKLGVADRTQAVIVALRRGLVH